MRFRGERQADLRVVGKPKVCESFKIKIMITSHCRIEYEMVLNIRETSSVNVESVESFCCASSAPICDRLPPRDRRPLVARVLGGVPRATEAFLLGTSSGRKKPFSSQKLVFPAWSGHLWMNS